MIVDAHAHIFHRGMPLVDQPRHRPTYDFTLQNYLQVLNANGVERAVIAAASPWGDYNDYTIESVAVTSRLRGTVILHPGKVYDLEAMKKKGIVGVRLPFIGLSQIPDITTTEYRRLLRQIAELNWHVHLHVEGRYIPDLLPLLENSGPRIVIDHLGRPSSKEGRDSPAFKAIVQSVKKGHSWIKASCSYRIGERANEHLQGFLQELGPERLFWASDCPFVGHEGELEYVDTLHWLQEQVPDEPARKLILGDNAAAFYFNAV
jgi:predicted TIM-barrel fold metal-dependent hydrolase